MTDNRLNGKSSGEVILQTKGQLAIIHLGSSDEKVITLDEARMTSLSKALVEVAKNQELRGLVIIGPSEGMFCAGADINIIEAVTDRKEAVNLAEVGQQSFELIANLEITTVAAISGPCVGGGFELALACDYRIATDSPKSRLGLPEVQLGILPGFGGTQRLPRLIGLPRALKLILSGRLLSSSQALKEKVVDRLISKKSGSPYADLLRSASDVALGSEGISRRRMSIVEKLVTFIPFIRNRVAATAKKGVLKKTRGHYPAPIKAIETTMIGLSNGIQAGLKAESEAIGDLVTSSESKSLVRVFNLRENASKIGKSLQQKVSNITVGVVGGGTMGAGIAATSLIAGNKVILVDLSSKARDAAKSRIERSLSKKRSLSDAQRKELAQRISYVEDLQQLAEAEIIIEAVPEKLELKQGIFEKISQIAADEALLATNTSSLSVSKLSESIKIPGRFLGLHFFNPVELMSLVEIVRGKQTSEQAVVVASAFVSRLNKFPIIVEDVPGFLVNRVLTPYLVEAGQLLADGYSLLDIDRAALEFGMPMGPFRLLDEVGLDVASAVAKIVEDGYDKRISGPNHAAKLVEKGILGKKSGAGFYNYDSDKKENGVNHVASQLLGVKSTSTANSSDRKEIAERLILPMINESIRCVDEGVAGMPGEGAAGQVDLGTVLGIGFAPFRGGVVNYAQNVGPKVIAEKLSKFETKLGERFKPWEGIKRRGSNGKSFFDRV